MHQANETSAKLNTFSESGYVMHCIEGYICNIYLIEYPQGFLLLDGGARGDMKRIESYFTDVLNRPVTDIVLAIACHMHPDHSAGAVFLRRKHGIPVAAHRDIDRWYAGIGGFLQHKVDCILMRLVARRNKRRYEIGMYKRNVKPDLVLEDGACLPGFEEWEVLHVPGHTMHDIVLYHEKSKVLYASDCFLNLDGRLMMPLPVLFPDKMRRSLERLAALDVRKVIPAHGEAIELTDGNEFFSKLIDILEKPPTRLTKRIDRISHYTPEYRRS